MIVCIMISAVVPRRWQCLPEVIALDRFGPQSRMGIEEPDAGSHFYKHRVDMRTSFSHPSKVSCITAA